MNYIVATTEGQPKNKFGGRNFAKLGDVSANTMAEANKIAKAKFGKKISVLSTADWNFFVNNKG